MFCSCSAASSSSSPPPLISSSFKTSAFCDFSFLFLFISQSSLFLFLLRLLRWCLLVARVKNRTRGSNLVVATEGARAATETAKASCGTFGSRVSFSSALLGPFYIRSVILPFSLSFPWSSSTTFFYTSPVLFKWPARFAFFSRWSREKSWLTRSFSWVWNETRRGYNETCTLDDPALVWLWTVCILKTIYTVQLNSIVTI